VGPNSETSAEIRSHRAARTAMARIPVLREHSF
jgi:hypothetical protein